MATFTWGEKAKWGDNIVKVENDLGNGRYYIRTSSGKRIHASSDLLEKIESEPTAAEEAQEHAGTFEKIKQGGINTPADLGKSIEEDHFSKEIKDLYSAKLTPSSLERVKSILETTNPKNPNFVSDPDKEVLYNWEGLGGKYDTEDSKTGGLHEFFTPYWLCKSIAEIVKSLDIKLNKVLDPATGTGRLLRYLNAKEIHAFEVNKLNADITQKLYSQSKVYNQAFETAFLKAPRFNSLDKKSWLGNDFDLVVSNPPYGGYSGQYKSLMPKVFTRFEFLFVALSMSLVKKGGYGIFVLPQSFMNNGNMYNKQKEEILKYNTFIDAIRLPNSIFASTDIGVDLLLLQKK
jgi:type I restriction-modification system DNA methylase subunit